MRLTLLAAAALLALSGCAVRSEVRPDGTVITKAALGPKARIVETNTTTAAEPMTPACPVTVSQSKDEVSTGWFSQGFAGVIEAAVTAVGLYFGVGG